jgi:hypothetical protein
MPKHTEEYKGKRIVVEEDESHISITIDEQAIPVIRDEQYRRYLTTVLPYFSFVSPVELAKEVVDHHAKLPDHSIDAA